MRKLNFAALVLLLALAPLGHAVVGHEPCTVCHVNAAPDTQGTQLIRGLPDPCVECHAARIGAGEHIINVVPSMAMPVELPLVDGRLGCITCHDPHGTAPGQLRISAEQLCQACHQR